jgi:hypothetical protein
VAARRPWSQARRRVALAAGAVTLAALAGLGVATSPRLRASLGDGGLGSRLDEWQVAATVVAHDPLLGLGPEGYRIGFTEQVDSAYVEAHGLDVQPDRAHNAVLDVAAVGGVGAAATYVVVLALVAVACWRAAADPDPLLAGLATGVLGYGVQQLFLFPLSELDPLFWLSAGMVVGATAAAHRPVPWLRVVGMAAAGTVPLLIWLGALDVAADRALAGTSLAGADRATGLRSDSIRNWFVASRLAGRGETILDVDAALDRIEEGLARSPRDPILRREHSTLLTERALRSLLEPDRVAAEEATRRYLEQAPNDPALLTNEALLAGAPGGQ